MTTPLFIADAMIREKESSAKLAVLLPDVHDKLHCIRNIIAIR
jgi:hypothetical protein